jgi:SAM-dependent methyltransferase
VSALYDTIGRSYAQHRQPDPRIAAHIEDALVDAHTVVNVGAGTGSYESPVRRVVAVEPAITMIRQRPPGPVVQAGAEALPFPDASFDAATAFITIHHWRDWRLGLREMRRVAGRVLVMGIDIAVMDEAFWLIPEYFPFVLDWPDPVTVDDVVAELGGASVITIPTPHDCVDGFFAAYWRRPEAYLDPSVRACISGLARAEPGLLEPGLTKLAADLESGAWQRRHADLLELDELDTGMRLVVT